jgi:hypothetical protein
VISSPARSGPAHVLLREHDPGVHGGSQAYPWVGDGRALARAGDCPRRGCPGDAPGYPNFEGKTAASRDKREAAVFLFLRPSGPTNLTPGTGCKQLWMSAYLGPYSGLPPPLGPHSGGLPPP